MDFGLEDERQYARDFSVYHHGRAADPGRKDHSTSFNSDACMPYLSLTAPRRHAWIGSAPMETFPKTAKAGLHLPRHNVDLLQSESVPW